MGFQIFTYCYILPTSIAVYLCRKISSRKKEMLVMHLFVALSVVLLSVYGVKLNWDPEIISLVMVSVTIIVLLFLLRFLSLIYLISSILQEVCLLLAGVIAIGSIGIVFGALVTSIVYTLAHFPRSIDWIHWHWKLPLLFIWGIISILLYFYFHQPLLNISIHAVAGAILIKKELLFIS